MSRRFQFSVRSLLAATLFMAAAVGLMVPKFDWQAGAAAIAMTIAITVASIILLCDGGPASRAFAIGALVPNSIMLAMVTMRITLNFSNGEGYSSAVRWESIEFEGIMFANQRKVFAIAWGLSLAMGLFAVAFRRLIGRSTHGDCRP
jgi:hypothetical protein